MKLTLGTVQFGMNYGIQGGKQPTEEAISEMLAYAQNKGIDHFDTASVYGNAEEILGRYRKTNPDRAEKMRIVSKLMPEAFTEKPKSQWKDIVLENVSTSLTKLKIPKLEAFLFHNAKYIFDESAVHALQYAYQEKMAEKIGVSIYTPQEAMKALEYDEIKVIQIPYNVFDQRLDNYGFLEKAKAKKIEVYARSSLLQGLILMEPEHLPGKMNFAKRYLERFRSICREYRISPLKVAVGYVGSHSCIDYVVFGVDNKVQLSEYLSIQEEGIPETMIKALRKEFKDVEEKLVNPVLWND